MLNSGDGTIVSCSFVCQLYLVVLISLVRHPTLWIFPAIPVSLLLNMVYLVDVLVPLVGLLVHLFHVFLIVRFSESDPNVI